MESDDIKEMRRQKFLNKQKLGIGNLNISSNSLNTANLQYNNESNNHTKIFNNESIIDSNRQVPTNYNSQENITNETKKVSYKKVYESQKDKENKKALFENLKTIVIIVISLVFLLSSK